MRATPLPDLIMYGRPGCSLCADARELVVGVLAERRSRALPTPSLVERDIESSETWLRAYLTTIPVLELGDQRLELVTSLARIRRFLSEALDKPDPPVTG